MYLIKGRRFPNNSTAGTIPRKASKDYLHESGVTKFRRNRNRHYVEEGGNIIISTPRTIVSQRDIPSGKKSCG